MVAAWRTALSERAFKDAIINCKENRRSPGVPRSAAVSNCSACRGPGGQAMELNRHGQSGSDDGDDGTHVAVPMVPIHTLPRSPVVSDGAQNLGAGGGADDNCDGDADAGAVSHTQPSAAGSASLGDGTATGTGVASAAVTGTGAGDADAADTAGHDSEAAARGAASVPRVEAAGKRAPRCLYSTADELRRAPVHAVYTQGRGARFWCGGRRMYGPHWYGAVALTAIIATLLAVFFGTMCLCWRLCVVCVRRVAHL